jgi:soluble lytic murein transglycosylase-like protein
MEHTMVGPRLVIPGTLISGSALSIFLFLITAGMTFPATINSSITLPVLEGKSASDLLQDNQSDQSAAALLPGESAVCQVSDKFPPKILQWCELITSYAIQNSLAPDLIAAVIWQESGGNPTAFSKSGAVGLMQVMPKDGKSAAFMCINGPCFSNRPSIAELNNPEFNIAYGTEMLADLYQRRGTIRDALMSYGPMNVGYYYADKVLNIYENYKVAP